MNRKLRGIVVFVAVTLAVIWCIPGVGQVLKGSISGTVTDPQGAVVSGAQVKATNVETGAVFTTTSDSSGLFRFNLIPTGTYNVSLAAQGFKTAEVKGKVVGAGEDVGIGSIRMAVGEASTTLEVVGTAPLVDTTQAQVTNVFSTVTLQSFAGIQENEGLDRLALFVPGISSSRSNNFSNTNGASISSNGLRGRNNDQEIDGQNNNDNSVGGPGLFVSDPEFVQQYVIVTNQFGPEYGRNSGSVVNIITKSGTNNWHGSFFGDERSSFTEALSNTQHNTNKPGVTCPSTGPSLCNPFSGPPRFNEEFSGGTIGGPVMKNKAFIFGGFDNDLFSGSGVFTTTSLFPTPNGLATLASCGSAINGTALSILQKFGPYAFSFGNPTPRDTSLTQIRDRFTAAGSPGPIVCPNVEVGGVTRTAPTPFHGFDFVVKNDIQLNSDTITSRYIFNRGNTFNRTDSGSVAAAAGWFDNVPALSQAALLSWTHNFTSRMVNEARVSFGRLNVEFGGGINPLLPVAGSLDQAFSNISIQGGFGTIGPATNIPQSRLVNTWQGQDNWNYVVGKHTLKSGVNWTYQRSPNIFLPNINGSFRYTDLSAFLSENRPNRVQIAQGTPNLDFREYDTFVYVGDDWKIKQSLTLNLGLTWTYYGQPANLFHDITTKRESNAATALWLQSLDLSLRTNPEIPAIKNSFGPSAGFAYSPQWGGWLTGHGKTTIRGGYRLLYDPPFYNIFVNISSSAPMTFLQTFSQTAASGLTGGLNATTFGAPVLPTGPNVRALLASQITRNTFDPRTQNETNVSNDFGPDKVHSWSFGFEREITKNSAFEVRYAGNHGFNLFQTVDANPYLGTTAKPGLLQAAPQFLPPGTPTTPCLTTAQVGPGAGTDVGRVSCGLGVGRTRNNGGFSDYHAAQAEFRATGLFKQLDLNLGYTFSKNLDNVSEIFGTGGAGNTLFAGQNPFQTGDAERSISGLDFPHTMQVRFTERLPFFKEQHGAIGHLLGGWTFSGTYLLQSGQPYTPVQALSEAIATNSVNFYDSAWAGAFVGSDTARPFFGNVSAPANTVGIYASDFCRGVFGITPAANAALPGACNTLLTSPSALLSFNSMNSTKGIATAGAALPGIAGSPITTNDVHFIINGAFAQGVFGSPFGNVPRNPLRDAITNRMDATVFKTIKFTERTSFTLHLTALNALNHFNFTNVDVNMENAGVGKFVNDFAIPSQFTAAGRTIWVGGTFRF